MSSSSTNPDYQAVSDLLASVRQRIRMYVWAEAILMALVLVGVVFWGGLALDWLLEPPPNIRLAVHGLLVLAVGTLLLWWGLQRWLVTLSDRSLALLVERKYPQVDDALSVAVDLHNSQLSDEEVHPELASRTLQEAAQLARSLNTEGLLNQIRLNRFALLAGGLAISIIALALGLPRVWDTYTQRLALSPQAWPRSVDLSIDGFVPDGQGGFVRKVARNSDVPLVVRASLAEKLKSPERVVIRYRWDGGRRGQDDLVRIGDATPGRDANQRFEYLFERIASNVEFDIRGGDDRLKRLRLEVVERPKVTGLNLDCYFPNYLQRSNRTLPAGPRVELPEGVRIVAQGTANKPLAEIHWRTAIQDEEGPLLSKQTTSDFHTEIELDARDVVLEVQLVDGDGISSTEPFRVTLVSRRDQSPQVLATRDGVGTAVTKNARLPIELFIEDDYAVDSAWLDIRRDDVELPRTTVKLAPGSRNEVVSLATVDLQELSQSHPEDPTFKFAAGQQLTIMAGAKDGYDLDESDRSSFARALSFEVVTEEELMSRLASSEQNLRQTFESIADKLVLLYDSLEKLSDQTTDATAAVASDASLLVVEDPTLVTPEPINAEPIEAESDSGRLARDATRLAESARQMGDEVLGVAAGFQDIYDQLQNNRIENTELSDRIGNRLASPLRELGENRMQAVAQQIDEIAKGNSTLPAMNETREAIVEVEALLREMQGLENYNEVIAMLRDIIRQQEQVKLKTKEEQKSELKNLLLD